MDGVVSKQEFAALLGVTPSALSMWIARRKLHGAALVGSGRSARIKVAVAQEQLKKNLELGHSSAIPVARLNGLPQAPAATPIAPVPVEAAREAPYEPAVEESIKLARLRQIELSNAKAEEEAEPRNGRYVLAEDVQQELGRTAARLLTLVETSLDANTIAATPPATARETLLLLRTTWRNIRVRAAKARGEEAAELLQLNEVVEDD